MGLSAALATAGRSLEVFSAGLQVAGQNISNAGSPDYIREKLVLNAGASYRQGNLVFGTGVDASGIRQQIDKYLEGRLHSAASDSSGANALTAGYQQLETALQSLGDNSIPSALNDFLAKINDVVNQPESGTVRTVAVTQGEQFAAQITSLNGQIDDQRTALNSKVTDLVGEANKLLDQIAKLNPQIASIEAGGLSKSDAGSLRSQRYAALNRLAEIIPIKSVEQPSGSVDVFLGSDTLVTSNQVQKLETVKGNDRGVEVLNVRVKDAQTPLSGSGGELNGTLNSRDQILGGFTDKLDTYTSNLIFEFNKLHACGEGVSGFTTVTATNQVADINAGLNAAGLKFIPQHGSFQIKVVNTATGIVQASEIPIDLDGIGSETSLDSLRTALNGVGNVTASITSDRRLSITAAAGYEIKFGNDTSGTLAALGINTFFSGADAHDIAVNSRVADNPDLFASGQGAGAGDGSNALQLAQFIDRPVSALGNVTVGDYYNQVVSQLSQDSASASAVAQGFAGFQDALKTQRAQTSGVSLDEEAINVLNFQKNYQATAKFIRTGDSLFTTWLNI